MNMKKVYIEPEIFSIVLDKEIMDVIQPTGGVVPDANKNHIFEDDEANNSTIWDTEESENQ